eukprot:TRINITY_DN1253_c0_g1_i12.p1 TRINITY_DN1253_c0_g1~~TRINITY_DN1253_c0_g1_i12.p1  ORF type:complete len:354 (-),score=33.41 TRINITY_DN1253_c0_g1_i12:29-1042(-)
MESTELARRKFLQALLKLTKDKLSSLKAEYFQLEQVGPAPGDSWGQHDAMVHAGLCNTAVKYPFMNRYSNLYPFEQNRFVLDTQDECDYINASWIKIAGESRDLILTMAPLHPASFSGKVKTDFGASSTESTCPQFWRMVLQSKTKLVVMLCKLEKGYQGCSQYYPESGEGVYGNISVTLKKEEKISEELVHREFLVKDENSEVLLHHLQFPLWPNYGVVKDVPQLASFLKKVNDKWNFLCATEDATPMIVHCSGGIGRSGTFSTALTAYRRLLEYQETGDESRLKSIRENGDGGINLVSTVKTMREQRHPWMVEGEAQYSLAYATVIHLLQELAQS